ncbi:histone-lysine N-methyltransferase SETMAR [Trichonephila clavipes]|nr:histone-lysine N-methyltransferase SETMAR [Trichonephila clavipes]
MSSTGRLLSNETISDPMHPSAPEEIEAQSREDKHTNKQAFTGFDKMDNVVSLINSETRSKTMSSPSFPGLLFKNINFYCHEGSIFDKIYAAAVIENDDKITEIIEIDQHVSSHSIAQELKIDHKTVLSHLHKVGFKKKLHVWVSRQLRPKNMKDRISICEVLVKRNEIDPFLIRTVTEDEKWVTYDNIV